VLECRTARDQLEEPDVADTLRRDLDDPPSEADLRAGMTALGLLEPQVLGWSLVSGRVDAADTLVRPRKGV
jgi:hypothetical protein